MRPGRSARERPTGAPQSLLLQNRLRSGTSGFSRTAERGSGRGTPGMLTSPAPSLLRPEAAAVEGPLRTDTEGAPSAPEPAVGDRDSRPDTDRREPEDPDEREDRPEEPDEDPEEPLPAPSGAPPPPPARVTPVAGEPTSPPAVTTGASPHVSQYSSPPPTSS
ncbi:hypothetical protein GCM10010507_27780 [Streptomyces cinnamoneus]|uniref:Uncharacterized protein n=1 Tax=Streptomyces cinnamoneus TaxID=53446 RepID=A0A918TKY9_STRCJ|nr:hypothetical protein GCM10010507_27780 [Streptomyces cinnamoneus]